MFITYFLKSIVKVNKLCTIQGVQKSGNSTMEKKNVKNKKLANNNLHLVLKL